MQQQNNNPYNQQLRGGQMPPFAPASPQMGMPMRPQRRMTWREKWMRNFGMDWHSLNRKSALTIPSWLTGRSIVFFFIAFAACTFAMGYPMELRDAIIASFSVILFFYAGRQVSIAYTNSNSKLFVRGVFLIGLLIRLIWVGYCYFIFNPDYWGTTYGDGADVEWYMPFGNAISEWIKVEKKISFDELRRIWCSSIDDVGYPFWLAIVNIITGGESDVFVPFIIKAIVSAYCSVAIYHVAKRHYGEGVARIAALFMVFNPNMIYWCGNMFKEAEMVFLTCLAIDNFDHMLNSGQRYTFRSFLPGMLATTALMFFRSVLGIVIFIAVFAHVIMASKRVMSLGKKVLAGVLVGVVLAVSMGDRIRTQSEALLDAAQSDRQKENMEWRSRREGGNEFAKYAGAAVFAPLIFTIPFPTFNAANESQLLQMQLSGGSYIKNILSFFVIIVMLMMLISGEWRRHVFILAYTVGYHVVLVMSEFAHSGRFHMPVWPMILLFAAYGIQVAKTNARVRKWLPIVLVLEVVACLAWNWFKLAGRGMV